MFCKIRKIQRIMDNREAISAVNRMHIFTIFTCNRQQRVAAQENLHKRHWNEKCIFRIAFTLKR